jgi:hypothetical protein
VQQSLIARHLPGRGARREILPDLKAAEYFWHRAWFEKNEMRLLLVGDWLHV